MTDYSQVDQLLFIWGCTTRVVEVEGCWTRAMWAGGCIIDEYYSCGWVRDGSGNTHRRHVLEVEGARGVG